jgi:glycolate oxidase iron-sulfur subunit
VNLAKFFLDEVERGGKSNLEISEAFYSCLDCYACVQVCPAGVNAGRISELGKRIITTHDLTANNQEKPIARMIVEATKRYGNPFGVRKQCADWAKGLEFDGNSGTLLYTGNMYQLMSYNPSLTKLQRLMGGRLSNYAARVATLFPSALSLSRFAVDRNLKMEMSSFLRNIYTLLKSVGMSFNYLREDEPYPGTLMYDYGYEKEFVEYGSQVNDLFKERGVRTIVTVDPHTYDILKNKYPRMVPHFDFNVTYYLDYLQGADFEREQGTLTLHEPCYFSLRDDGYARLGELISKIATVEYPARSGKRTMCCGGPDEALFGNISNEISKKRTAQLKAAGEGRIITACPVCYANLHEGAYVEDVSEFLVNRLRGPSLSAQVISTKRTS